MRGYLYVINMGTSRSYELLFPRSDTGSDNRVEAAKDYVVPAGQGCFKVSGPPGQDVVYWLVSPVDMGKQYQPLPPPLAPADRPSADHAALRRFHLQGPRRLRRYLRRREACRQAAREYERRGEAQPARATLYSGQ